MSDLNLLLIFAGYFGLGALISFLFGFLAPYEFGDDGLAIVLSFFWPISVPILVLWISFRMGVNAMEWLLDN